MSTRARSGAAVSLCEAMTRGLAPDGGLYVPERIPRLARLPRASWSLSEIAAAVLRPFFEGEVLEGALDDLCRAAFTFPAPVRWLEEDQTGLLEQFHGPTAAFKDFGARFLAECLARLRQSPVVTTVLVATSGDTGAAVASAFHRRPGFRVVVLYPDGRVSARQAHQLGAFGDNVHTFRVSGTFDDCQALVKQAFADDELQAAAPLTSANSISLGRLLPQLASYTQAALVAGPLSVVVPTGNLGNAAACMLAQDMGLPIVAVALATNANRVVPEFLASGRYTPRPSVATLANAMDVGAPSNLERLRAWHSDAELTAKLRCDSVDDEQIRQTIRESWERFGVALCPHTACGVEVLRRLRGSGAAGRWLVAATAHPAKFESIVEPLIGRAVPLPPPLAELLSRPSSAAPLEPAPEALRVELLRLAQR